VLLDNFAETLRVTRQFLCLDVLRFDHSDEDLREFKSDQCAVIIAVLLIFFVVRRSEGDVQDSRRESRIENASFLAELVELRLADIWRATTLGYDLYKDLFQEYEMSLDDRLAAFQVSFILDEFVYLPIPEIVIQAALNGLRGILLPVTEYRVFLTKIFRHELFF